MDIKNLLEVKQLIRELNRLEEEKEQVWSGTNFRFTYKAKDGGNADFYLNRFLVEYQAMQTAIVARIDKEIAEIKTKLEKL